jgi:hypothetical protein
VSFKFLRHSTSLNQRETILDVRQTRERQAQRALNHVGLGQELAEDGVPPAEPQQARAGAAGDRLAAAGDEGDVAEPRDGRREGHPEVLLVRPADLGDVPAHGKHALELGVALHARIRIRQLRVGVQVHDHGAVDGVDPPLQVLHEGSVRVPELAGEYVVPVVGVDEDKVVLVAVAGDEVLGIRYVEEDAVVYASP